MRNAIWAAIILFPLFVYCDAFAAALTLSEAELNELRILHQNPKQYASKLDSKSLAVSAIAAAIAYGKDPDNNWQRLFIVFSVADYRLRASGNYTMIDSNQLVHQADILQTQNPNLPDKVYLPLLAFIYYRDRNEWVETAKGRISAARFFRAAFLAAYYKGTTVDAPKLARDIDLWAQKSTKQ
jgi:hypothetical protein